MRGLNTVSCEDEGRGQGEVSTRHGTPKSPSKPPGAQGKAGNRPCFPAPTSHSRNQSAAAWVSDSQSPELALQCQSLSRVQLFATPQTVAHQALLSMEFSRQEYWSGLPFPPPGDLPDPGVEPSSPALQADSIPSEPPGKPLVYLYARTGSQRLTLLFKPPNL